MRDVLEDKLQAFEAHSRATLNQSMAVDVLLCFLCGFRNMLYTVNPDNVQYFRQELEKITRYVYGVRLLSFNCTATSLQDILSQVLHVPLKQARMIAASRAALPFSTISAKYASSTTAQASSSDANPTQINTFDIENVRKQLGKSLSQPWAQELLSSLTAQGDILPGSFIPGASMPQTPLVVVLEGLDNSSLQFQRLLLEVLQTRTVRQAGQTRRLPSGLVFVGTLITSKQHKALLPRLLDHFTFGQPYLPATTQSQSIPPNFLPIFDQVELETILASVTTTYCEPDILRYIRDINVHVRFHPLVHYGITAITTEDFYRAARAWAYIAGFDYVTPDHVREIAQKVLPHRLTFIEPTTDQLQVVKEVLEAIEPPV